MPRLNRRGQALMGRGSGPASVDGRVIITPGGGPACWLDDHTLLVNSNALGGSWSVLSVDVVTRIPTMMTFGGANDLCAGGGRWLGWTPGTGLFGTLGHLPKGAVRGAGPDGTLAYCPDRQVGYGLMLVSPDGTQHYLPDEAVYDEYALQVIGPGQAVWYTGARISQVGIPAPRPAVPSGKLRRVVVDGVVWLIYYAPSLNALVVQEDGAQEGYLVNTTGTAFNHDALEIATGGAMIAWSTTAGEAPGDLVTYTLAGVQALFTLQSLVAPPAAQPTFHFSHPVLIAPFKDPQGTSQAPAEIIVNQTGPGTTRPYFAAEDSLGNFAGDLLGIYTEAPFPTEALALAARYQTRLLLAHDAAGTWTLPRNLRPWDIPALECYRYAEETLAVAAARWSAQLATLLARWPGDCAIIAQFYCMGGAPPQELWPVGEVLRGLDRLSELVNRSERIKVIAPFSYQRVNGIVGHPELQAAFAALLRAADLAGGPVLLPVGIPIVYPEDPEAPAIPPIPSGPSGPPQPPLPPVLPASTSQGVLMLIDPAKELLYVAKVLNHTTRPGLSTLVNPQGRVISIQPDGTVKDRDPGTDGGYETCQISGNLATFRPDDTKPPYTFGYVLVDKL